MKAKAKQGSGVPLIYGFLASALFFAQTKLFDMVAMVENSVKMVFAQMYFLIERKK